MGVAMRRQAQADTAMIITMMYEELISLTINSLGGASPATQAEMPPSPTKRLVCRERERQRNYACNAQQESFWCLFARVTQSGDSFIFFDLHWNWIVYFSLRAHFIRRSFI